MEREVREMKLFRRWGSDEAVELQCNSAEKKSEKESFNLLVQPEILPSDSVIKLNRLIEIFNLESAREAGILHFHDRTN